MPCALPFFVWMPLPGNAARMLAFECLGLGKVGMLCKFNSWKGSILHENHTATLEEQWIYNMGPKQKIQDGPEAENAILAQSRKHMRMSD